jgi:tetratricopeptide (TPR) repeat protein
MLPPAPTSSRHAKDSAIERRDCRTFGSDSAMMKLVLVQLLILAMVRAHIQSGSFDDQVAYGQLLLRQSAFGESEKTLWAAMELPQLSQAQRLRLVANLNSVALAYRHSRRHEEAEALYHKVLALWDQNRMPPDRYQATIMVGLATLYEGQHKFSRALSLQRRALTIWQHAVASDDPAVVNAMRNVGGLLYRLHRYTEAARFYQQALTIQEKASARQDSDTAMTMNNLAAVHHATGRYREAADLYRQVLNIWQTALEPEHPDVAKTLNNLATLEFEQRRYQPAEQLYGRAVAILESDTSGNASALAATRSNLARLYIIQSRYADAERLNLTALTAWQEVAGTEHLSLVPLLSRHAIILRKLKKKSDAAQFLARAATIKAKHGPDVIAATVDMSLLRPARDE